MKTQLRIVMEMNEVDGNMEIKISSIDHVHVHLSNKNQFTWPLMIRIIIGIVTYT